MPAPLTDAVRRRLFALWQKGTSPAALARQLRLPPRSVRRLCHAFDQRGAAALAPASPRPQPATPGPALQQALLLHKQHPTWGAPYLRLRLAHLRPELVPLPSARTLQRWFQRQRQPPAPPGRKPAADPPRARQAHAVWQMDAVEQLRLATGEQVSWLRWVDELTGAVLGTAVFPPRHLRASPRDGRPAGRAAAVAALGSAANAAGRQRRPVGQLERPAHALRVVGHRRRGRSTLERPLLSATEPEGRTLAGDGQALGGTLDL